MFISTERSDVTAALPSLGQAQEDSVHTFTYKHILSLRYVLYYSELDQRNQWAISYTHRELSIAPPGAG